GHRRLRAIDLGKAEGAAAREERGQRQGARPGRRRLVGPVHRRGQRGGGRPLRRAGRHVQRQGADPMRRHLLRRRPHLQYHQGAHGARKGRRGRALQRGGRVRHGVWRQGVQRAAEGAHGGRDDAVGRRHQ
ncbi:hypothetical protein LTR16_010795, partial [Cryomyces antarcticus]